MQLTAKIFRGGRGRGYEERAGGGVVKGPRIFNVRYQEGDTAKEGKGEAARKHYTREQLRYLQRSLKRGSTFQSITCKEEEEKVEYTYLKRSHPPNRKLILALEGSRIFIL